MSAGLFFTTSGASPLAIIQTWSPVLRSIAVMRPHGGRTSGKTARPEAGTAGALAGDGGAAVCTAPLGAPGCAPNAATYAMSVRFGSPF